MKTLRLLFSLMLACGLLACAPGMQGFNSVLSGSGFGGGGTDVNSLFDAGSKLVKAAEGLNEEEEYYLGRGVSAMLLSRYKPYNNATATTYLNKVGLILARASDRPETYGGYHFLMLDTPEVNAFAAPGGFVFVTHGFVSLAKDEDQLAAILAHEVGHVVNGDGRKAISQANLTSALLTIGQQAAAQSSNLYVAELTTVFGKSIEDVFQTLVDKGYSRSQEYDADEYAANLMKKTGYNPQGLVSVLQGLETRSKNDEAGLFSTHPDADNRIGKVEDYVEGAAIDSTAQSLRAKRFSAAMRGVA